MSSNIKNQPYVTGFCGVRNHSRCPVVIDQGKRRFATCTCSCHEGQDISALMEAPPVTLGVHQTASHANGAAPAVSNGTSAHPNGSTALQDASWGASVDADIHVLQGLIRQMLSGLVDA